MSIIGNSLIQPLPFLFELQRILTWILPAVFEQGRIIQDVIGFEYHPRIGVASVFAPSGLV
jgi:hypothetical protein